jgi:sulfite reductase (NADPH) flavoprotein alpha-component
MSSIFYGSLVSKHCLSGLQFPWQTWHLDIQVPHCLEFRPGDSVAIYPKNSSRVVNELLAYFSLDPAALLFDEKTGESIEAYEFFSSNRDIRRLSSPLILALVGCADTHADRLILEKLANDENFVEAHDLLGFLTRFFPRGIRVEKLIPHLRTLLPRLYSISSGPSFCEDRIELTVAKAHVHINGECRPGLCSGYLIDEAPLGRPSLKMSLQPSKHVTFPPDGVNKIFIATGTGIAPFRSQMQEHDFGVAPTSKYWLFFGGRKRENDFFYEDFWGRHIERGYLTLTLAFSQDQEVKIYVQHKMWEERRRLWEWIENGAAVYVCGNARTMAKDVESCLLNIATEVGGRTDDQAADFLKNLRRSGRYRKDVY